MDEQRHSRFEAALWASLGAGPTQRTITMAQLGGTVRVQELGAGDPVLFLHGASNAGSSWAPLVARLSGLRCILVDRPGCGLSPRLPQPLTDMARLGTFADALVADVLDGLGVESAAVVGTSFGGYFALRGAAARPRRVTRLVLLGWSFGAPMGSTPLVMRIAVQPLLGRLMTKVPVGRRMTRSMLKQIGLRHAVESGRFDAGDDGGRRHAPWMDDPDHVADRVGRFLRAALP